jgi:hypothetical protein
VNEIFTVLLWHNNRVTRFSWFVCECCQAEGPAAADEEESEKSESEVHDENDDDEDGSDEVSLDTFL